ncbi:hypothetical protein ACMVCI_002121 [Yersinia enterocolitica]|uniref:hypothetical protein n=1 Tax=Yersinia enterocolitica TaxID=630 RepID=UPI0003D947E2|nr:hypothetical protein [Yersinia enterocolitica]EKN3734718.1 hypothetical protein [Yersinia enterocolitica]EKN4178234.1 hypothetical protein [Yersinia enterocolitica]EKN4861476.1 hypothetical protein [Yersinia enterocolitica]EKN6077476.1 hypothetical protein [Yersinia enterocolitica]EKN6112308.1 hypothetical protein [Yersinia enterocolitica]
MTIAELYARYEITPAEFKPNETAIDFGRRVMSTSFSATEQKGVIYSTGSNIENIDINQNNKKVHQLYSY